MSRWLRTPAPLSFAGIAVLWCMALVLLPVFVSAQGASSDDAAARRLLVEAQRLERRGDLEAALREYRLLVDRFPESEASAEAHYSLAEVLYRQGNVIPARQAIDELVARRPRSPWSAAAYVLQGRMLAERPTGPGDLEAARAVLRRLPLLYGRDSYPELSWRAEARVLVGEISLDLGQPGDAAAAFIQALEDEVAGPWTARARLGLAKVLLANGDWVAASAELQRAAESGVAPEALLARQRLTLLHRVQIRPTAGLPSWRRARPLAVPGIELRKPVGVAAAPDGTVVVGDRGSDTVYRLAPDGSLEDRLELTEPGRPWWQDGEVYLPSGDAVSRLTDRSSQSFMAPRGRKMEPVKDLAAGRRGRLGQWYLLDEQSDRVLVFIPAGRYLATLAEGEPVDVARDAQGRIYVLDGKSSQVERFSPDGTSLGVIVRDLGRKPQALDVDDLGNLYVLDRDAGRISIYQPDGQLMATLGPQLPGGLELRNPLDLAVDGAGRVLVVDGKLSTLVVVE